MVGVWRILYVLKGFSEDIIWDLNQFQEGLEIAIAGQFSQCFARTFGHPNAGTRSLMVSERWLGPLRPSPDPRRSFP